MGETQLARAPEELLHSPSSAAASSTVRDQIRKVMPATALANMRPPAFEEKAVVVPYGDALRVRYDENPDRMVVTGRKHSVEFKKTKVNDEDVSQVTISGARDVRLYTSVGLRIVNRKHTEFILHYTTGIRTLLGPKLVNSITNSRSIYFFCGKTLFLLDQPNNIVKVWASEMGYDLGRGFIYFCVPEPRPIFANSIQL